MMVYIGALVLLVAVGLGVSAMYFASSTVRDEAETALLQMTDLGAKEVEIRVQSNLDVLYEVANREGIQTMNWNTQQEILKKDVQRLGYLDMAIVTPDGQARYVLGDTISELGDRTYVKLGFEGQANVSDVLISRVTNSAVLMYAAPIFRNNEVVGVLIARRDGNDLNSITDQMGFGQEGYAYVINRVGTTVAHPNRDNVMNQVNILDMAKEDDNFKSLARMVEKALVEENGLGSYTFNKIEMYSAYAPILGTDWILINVALEEEVLSGLEAMRGLLILITVLVLLIGLLISALVGRSISKPITYLSKEIARVSDYDLRDVYDKESDHVMKRQDEIGLITQAIIKMKNNLKSLIHEITEDSVNLASSSQELTATSQQSSLASDEIARTIEDIASGATDQAKETTQGAEEMALLGEIITSEIGLVKTLNASAEDVNRLKEEGLIVLKDLEEKTDENNAAAQAVQKIIIETNNSADKIEAASDMIKSIADQTNLLALNAAIEAARAGEAGKGFAVVADEIRKLAEQSNQFAGEISTIISNLSKMTSQGVQMMEDASEIVKAQMTSLSNTHNKFEGISEAVDRVKTVVIDLNASTDMMMNKKVQIIEIIESLSAISQENAAGTEEASAAVEEQTASMAQISGASEDLSKLAEDMQKSISRFKI